MSDRTKYRREHVENLQIRPGNAEDVPFIFRRTLIDLRQSDFYTSMPNRLYYTYAHRAWEHTLTRGIVRVAYSGAYEKDDVVISGNTRFILGFIVADVTNIGLVVHYCNVRQDTDEYGKVRATYRKQGIARRLVQGLLDDYRLKKVIYTQRTAMFRRFVHFREKIDQQRDLFEYNPCLFFTLLPPGWETGVIPTMDAEIAPQLRELQGQWSA